MTKTTPNFVDAPATDENIAAGLVKPVYEVHTENNIFKANNLDEVMKLWKESLDPSPVLNVVRCG